MLTKLEETNRVIERFIKRFPSREHPIIINALADLQLLLIDSSHIIEDMIKAIDSVDVSLNKDNN
jgi:hypothetical protein